MSGLGFLDLVIGLIFIYFILSLVVSVLQELRANLFQLRSKNLEKWYKDTFDENNLGNELLNHKLIKGLVKKNRKPAYIPSAYFVTALLDMIHHKKDDQGSAIEETYDISYYKEVGTGN